MRRNAPFPKVIVLIHFEENMKRGDNSLELLKMKTKMVVAQNTHQDAAKSLWEINVK